jgi:hypothetical protein
MNGWRERPATTVKPDGGRVPRTLRDDSGSELEDGDACAGGWDERMKIFRSALRSVGSDARHDGASGTAPQPTHSDMAAAAILRLAAPGGSSLAAVKAAILSTGATVRPARPHGPPCAAPLRRSTRGYGAIIIL